MIIKYMGTTYDVRKLSYFFIVGSDNDAIWANLIESFMQALETSTILGGVCLHHCS